MTDRGSGGMTTHLLVFFSAFLVTALP